MALKIVTGGTTGVANGTLVSSGNPLVIVSLNTAIDAHIRCDDGYWSNDQDFDLPAELEVSFDGGSVWYGNDDEPITAPEIYAVNYPIKIRQTTAAVSTSGSFVTDGTYTAIAALSTPTLTATVISSSQIDLSWTNVANEDASPGYTLQRGTDGVTYGTTVGTYAQNVTTASDTGLSTSTHYYYRVKAEGSGRYSDSGWGTDDDTTSSNLYRDDTFTDSDGVSLEAHTPTGTNPGGSWTFDYNPGTPISALKVKSNRAMTILSSGAPAAITVEASLSGSSNANCAAESDIYVHSILSGAATLIGCRRSGTYANRYMYRFVMLGDGSLTLGKIVNGSYTALDTDTQSISAGQTYTLRVEASSTTIKGYVNGVEKCSTTDSTVTSGGGLCVQLSGPTTGLIGDSPTGFAIDAVRLYNI